MDIDEEGYKEAIKAVAKGRHSVRDIIEAYLIGARKGHDKPTLKAIK